jgi:hypothetical protein
MVDVFFLGRCGQRQNNGNKRKEQDFHGDTSWKLTREVFSLPTDRHREHDNYHVG